MSSLPPTHAPLPCAVVTRKGLACGAPSIAMLPQLGPVCALHDYHHRRSLQARQNLQVRVSPEDLAALDRLAQGYNLSRSDAVRRLLHRVPMPAAQVDADSYRELRRVGVNLNQIAKSLNRGDDPDLEVIHQHLEHLEARLDHFALLLCGSTVEEVAP